jgi:hypothetical protein
VCLWALTSFFECVFEPLPSFLVCLWALTSWAVHFLTLPHFECAFEPRHPFSRQVTHYNATILHVFFIWVGHPLQWDYSSTWVGHLWQQDRSSFFPFFR